MPRILRIQYPGARYQSRKKGRSRKGEAEKGREAEKGQVVFCNFYDC